MMALERCLWVLRCLSVEFSLCCIHRSIGHLLLNYKIFIFFIEYDKWSSWKTSGYTLVISETSHISIIVFEIKYSPVLMVENRFGYLSKALHKILVNSPSLPLFRKTKLNQQIKVKQNSSLSNLRHVANNFPEIIFQNQISSQNF